MLRLAPLLRCVLIVALCLDGSVGVWRTTAMATQLARHAASSAQRTHSGDIAAAAIDQDCDDRDIAAPHSAQEQRPLHDDCDCSSSGCSCACAFTGIAFAHAVPFVAQHLLAVRPAVILRNQTVGHFSSAVFRPPIG